MQTLLLTIGEEIDARNPVRTKNRLEKALTTLQEDKVVAAWEYAPGWDKNHRRPQGVAALLAGLEGDRRATRRGRRSLREDAARPRRRPDPYRHLRTSARSSGRPAAPTA